MRLYVFIYARFNGECASQFDSFIEQMMMTLAQLSSSSIAPPPPRRHLRRKRSARYYCATTTKAKSSNDRDVNDDGEKMRKNPDLYHEFGGELDDDIMENTNEQRRQRKKKPDILAPAGGWPQLEAAIKTARIACTSAWSF